MKTLLEWRLERLVEDLSPGFGAGQNSVPQNGIGGDDMDGIDPNVLNIISKVVPQVRAEFQDPQDAIEAIALACIVALNNLGRTESIEKIKRAVDIESPNGPLMSGMPRHRSPNASPASEIPG